MRISGKKIDVLDRRGKRRRQFGCRRRRTRCARSLRNLPDARKIDAITGNKMTRGEGDESSLFIDLAFDVNAPDAAIVPDVQQPDLHALFPPAASTHKRSRIIVLVDDNVVAFAKREAVGDEAQAKRSGADKGNLLRLRSKELRRECAGFAEQSLGDHSFLVIQIRRIDVALHGFRDAAGQGANPGVGEKNLVDGNRKFVTPQFLVAENLLNGHCSIMSPIWP
jgi:hypothetical protein